jgi:hypothetical protein
MYGDKWWGYVHVNGVVTITPEDPHYYHERRMRMRPPHHISPVKKIVGPFVEDLADELEGDIKMVRRKIMSALYDKPLEELLNEP